jgi:hypothetical protein
MEKERAAYMQTLKRKCSLAAVKNYPSNQAIQAHSACAAKHYNGSRLKPMDDKQAKCSKKNCDHLIRFGGKTRRRRGGGHGHYTTSQFSRRSELPDGRINRMFSQQRKSVAAQNELDMEQLQLVAKEITTKPENPNFVIGKLSHVFFYPNYDNLTQEDMEEMNTIIPERFKEYGRKLDLKLRKLLYYNLIIIVIASLVASKRAKLV